MTGLQLDRRLFYEHLKTKLYVSFRITHNDFSNGYGMGELFLFFDKAYR